MEIICRDRAGAYAEGARLGAPDALQVGTLVNRRLERYRPIRVIAAGSLINALAFGIFAALGLAPAWAAVVGLFVAMVPYNFAETAATPFSEDLSVSLAPEHLRGRYLAVYQLSWTFGQTVAPLLLILLLDLGAAWPWVFLMTLGLLAVPALLLLERMVEAAKPKQNDGDAGERDKAGELPTASISAVASASTPL